MHIHIHIYIYNMHIHTYIYKYNIVLHIYIYIYITVKGHYYKKWTDLEVASWIAPRRRYTPLRYRAAAPTAWRAPVATAGRRHPGAWRCSARLDPGSHWEIRFIDRFIDRWVDIHVCIEILIDRNKYWYWYRCWYWCRFRCVDVDVGVDHHSI